MKNGHNDMLEPIGAIPFLFSTRSFLANGFSTLRLLRESGWHEPQTLASRSVLPGLPHDFFLVARA
jgi:hypothetical protein